MKADYSRSTMRLEIRMPVSCCRTKIYILKVLCMPVYLNQCVYLRHTGLH